MRPNYTLSVRVCLLAGLRASCLHGGIRDTAALDARLEEFLERLTPSLGRPEQRRQARTYVAGLLLEGERKSVQPLAGRLGATDNGQALHHFVAHSPWACEGLFAAMAREAARLWPRPHAWIIDETSFPKAGRHSVGVGPQYCGALGKIANCQVAVSLHYAAGTLEQAASAALGWRLFLPREWVGDAARRQKAGVPASLAYRSKNALALELVDEALARGLPPAPVLADSDYGDDYCWRAALRARAVGYCVAVEPRAKAWTSAPVGSPPLRRRSAPAQRPVARPQAPGPDRPRAATPSLAQTHLARGHARTDAGPFCARADLGEPRLHAAPARRGTHPRVALHRVAPGQRSAHRLLAGPLGQRHEDAHAQSLGRAGAGNAGAWSRTTANSRTNWAWTTSRAARGRAGTTTSP